MANETGTRRRLASPRGGISMINAVDGLQYEPYWLCHTVRLWPAFAPAKQAASSTPGACRIRTAKGRPMPRPGHASLNFLPPSACLCLPSGTKFSTMLTAARNGSCSFFYFLFSPHISAIAWLSSPQCQWHGRWRRSDHNLEKRCPAFLPGA